MAGLSASLFVNYVNPYRFNGARIASFTTVDTYLGYTFKDVGPLRGLTLGLNVQNLFDKAPPFVNIPAYQYNAGGYDPTQANAIGRMISFTVGTKF